MDRDGRELISDSGFDDAANAPGRFWREGSSSAAAGRRFACHFAQLPDNLLIEPGVDQQQPVLVQITKWTDLRVGPAWHMKRRTVLGPV